MKQYNSIKGKYPDALLLFRVGDFYETFSEDAIKTSQILGITLTKRANGAAAYIELAGFPHHALDTYLPKLVRAGQRVAICDQLEDPKTTKTIVKRGVTELVTPGVAYSDKILEHRKNNFLATLHLSDQQAGVAFLDISTGEFMIAQGSIDYIDKLIQSFRPSEIVYQRNKQKEFSALFGTSFYSYGIDEWIFKPDYTREQLLKHFGTKNLKGFGVEELELATIAAGATLHYIADNQQNKLQHITTVARIEQDSYVWMDKFTMRNLELVYSPHEEAQTLIETIDRTITPMGSRLLKRWILLPLKELATIRERQSIVTHLTEEQELADAVANHLKEIGDLERLVSKVATARVSPRELLQLKRALIAIEPIKTLCAQSKNKELNIIAEQINLCQLIRDKIAQELHPDPPVLINKGSVIADGVSAELDELRSIAYAGKDFLLKIQQRESERTGIGSLKVAFNNVFGYYIEVTNANKDKVPTDWIRKQTLVNAERYITEELKVYEEKILGAEDKILAIETALFNTLVLATTEYVQPIQHNAACVAKLDCLLSFANIGIEHGYVMPEVNDSKQIDIKQGRHPVIEQRLPVGETYVANDVFLDNDDQQIIMITGPNMSGKSAILRQTALIVLLAQMGCLVPAQAAQIGLVDKIFTRVGASDNISLGESTFMVEMNETASILNNLSDRSLVLLDEIGRGTSTYDGISIAWAIAEYIYTQPQARAKTLFATHYHELNEMEKSFPRIKNYNVAVKELDNHIIFLRKLVRGGSEHSFGIHVAKMAGMPTQVLKRANEMLSQLESSHSNSQLNKTTQSVKMQEMQLSFFQLDDPILEQIREILLSTDINTLTPVEALMKLHDIKKMLGK